MITNLYIINSAGLAIYTHHWTSAQDLDEQLLTGFLTAITDFSQEAIKGSQLNSLDLDIGRLVLYKDPSSELSVAAICDSLDHPRLLQNLLKKIYDGFLDQFEDAKEFSDVERFRKFTPNLAKIVRFKTYKRSKLRLGIGIGAGILIFSLLFYFAVLFFTLPELNLYITRNINILFTFLTNYDDLLPFDHPNNLAAVNNFLNGLIATAFLLIFNLSISVMILYLPSAIVAGFISGSRKRGKYIAVFMFGYLIIVGLILFSMADKNPVIGLMSVSTIFSFGVFLPLILILILAGAYFGGYLMDIWRLHPIQKEKSSTASKAKSVEKI